MGWRTSAATDQGTLWHIGSFVSVMCGPGVGDEKNRRNLDDPAASGSAAVTAEPYNWRRHISRMTNREP